LGTSIFDTPKTDVTLVSSDAMYQEIACSFQNQHKRVTKILRIQNLTLFEQFVVHRKAFAKRYANDPKITVSMLLYHGTPSENVESILHHGFDRGFSGNHVGTVYGHGVYFSNDLREALNYTERTGEGCVFLCDVLIGQCCLGNSDVTTLPRLGYNKTECYDTAVNNVSCPKIFVKFHDAQVYPLYLIKFSS
jgi:hypothetical protein